MKRLSILKSENLSEIQRMEVLFQTLFKIQ